MFRFLFVVTLLVLCVIGLGFYFGYFRIESDRADGTTHFILTVYEKKIQEDEKKAMDKVHDVGRPSKD